MKVHATAKYIRISPRKTRLVVDLVRGMAIEEARAQLKFSAKNAAKPVLKVLNSAIANAENNLGLDVSNFRVVEAYVNEGPTIHRFMPRAQGRATALRKRMSHITIAVGDEAEVVEKPEAVEVEKKVEEKKPAAKKVVKKKPAAKKAPAKPKAKKESPKKDN